MSGMRQMVQTFVGGELSPEMFGRLQDAKYQNGAAVLQNAVAKVAGPAYRRPGLAFVHAAKYADKKARLVSFTYSTSQTLVIEMGEGYFRFYHDGGVVLTGALPEYRPTATITASDATFNTITFASHGFQTGDPIVFTLDGTGVTPAPLAAGTTYYAIRLSATVIQVALTHADAVAGTPVFVNLTGTHTNYVSCHYKYEVADMVQRTVGPVVHFFRCIATQYTNFTEYPPDTGAPADTYWYQMPDTGELEVPNSYLESELFDVVTFGKGNKLTLLHQAHAASELVWVSGITWTFGAIAFGATLPTPAQPTVTPTYGELVSVIAVQVASGSFNYLKTMGGVAHGLALGQAVELRSCTGIADGTYIVADSDGPGAQLDEFALKNKTTGAPITATATGAVTGTARRVSLDDADSNYYVVTAIDSNDTETVASPASAASDNNLFAQGAKNTISWAGIPGAKRYRVYKRISGIYGYIGQVDAALASSFEDDGSIAPDLGIVPPVVDSGFVNGIKPGAGCYFEGRRVFAGDAVAVQDVWMTRSGTESDMAYHLPLQATDRVYAPVASLELAEIRHCIPIGQLVLLTSSAEFRLSPVNTDAVTADSVAARAQTHVGSSRVAPIVANSSVLFCAARGGHVREMGYSVERDGFVTADMSLRAAHLFDGYTLLQSAWQKAPQQLAMWPSSSGQLLCLTYVPEEAVAAWSRISTDGVIESVAVVAEGDEDRAYCLVQRQVNGNTVRYVERMAQHQTPALADCFFVDCGLTYSGGPTLTVSGLDHLDGKEVAVLADGLVQARKTVTGGTITLDAAASKVHVGLPYKTQIKTVPASFNIEAFGSGRPKSVSKVWVRVDRSGKFMVGPEETSVLPAAEITEDALYSGLVEVAVNPLWNLDGQIIIEQEDPLPLMVVSLTADMAVGG